MIGPAIRLAVMLAASAMTASVALAQPAPRDPAWPVRPVRLIAPFPAASTVDVVARILGQKLSARLGQQLVIDNRVGASANIGAGQLRALAVTSKTKVAALPEVPTMDAAGVPGYDAVLWFALVGPAGLPAAIAARLNREVIDILNSPDMTAAFEQQGFIAE